jgi:hypothetical protein
MIPISKGVEDMNILKMNIPNITSVETALTIYYNNPEIGNKEITALFGKHSPTTISKLKKMVKAEMDKQGLFSYGLNTIQTEMAYDVWGIDIKGLERRFKKIKELNLSA